MWFNIDAAELLPSDLDAVGVGFYSDMTPSTGSGIEFNADDLKSLGFEGKTGQVQTVLSNGRVAIAVGLGARDEVKPDTVRRAAAQLVRQSGKYARIGVALEGDSQAIAEGLVLGAYKFFRYKSKPESPTLERVLVVGADSNALGVGRAIADAVALARDLINTPAADMTPGALADAAERLQGVRTEIWDEARVAVEGLGGLIGVSLGSAQPPRLIKMFWEPEGATKSIALVGKGITFDSGGLSIKSGDGMMTMKTDMSGAAAVIAAMSVMPVLAPNVRVVGIAAATENVIGPNATKPGDVLKARNGKTMEVLNTDAEGRLVLADALSLAVEEHVDSIVDLATLTGACKVALGSDIAGVFGNNADFTASVMSAAQRSGENLWELPLHKSYRKLIDSEIADIKNIGPGGPGATTAALFLQEFVADKPWVHLDIAGPARSDADDGYQTKGGSGFGVRTVVEIIRHL